jgi:hypothetical protein
MKKFISFLVLLVLIVVGILALLLRNDFEKISENREVFASTLRARVDETVFTYAPREVRLFLFKHMPGLFPVLMVCEIREGADRHSIFLGDEIGAGDRDQDFFCPNGIEGRLRTGGKVRLMPQGGAAAFRIVSGQLNLSFKDIAPGVQSDYYQLSLKGQPAGNRMAFAASHDGYTIGCLNGSVEGQFTALPAGQGKNGFLLTRDCLAKLKWSPSSPDKHLMPGDILAAADLEKSRKEWAPQDLNSRFSELGIDPVANPSLVMRVDAVPASNDTIKLSWQAAAPQGLYNCTLYTQENTRAAAQVAHRFQAQAAAGELVLLKGFLKFWMSLSCNNGAQSFTSNLLAPML